MRRVVLIVALATFASLAPSAQQPASQPKKLKVHISVDMEGVAGAVTGDQLGQRGSSTAASANS